MTLHLKVVFEKHELAVAVVHITAGLMLSSRVEETARHGTS
ncbi:MAG: hypothetical protein P4L43_05715 [Syntrophobacteraceae bacterium]|nr:hypothetical protein [Syntrophobacteraceae bacterium]